MRLRATFALAALAVASLVQAADPAVETLLGKMRDAYKAAKTAKLDVAITIMGPEDQKLEGKATVRYTNPKNARADITFKHPATSEERTMIYVQDGAKMGLGDEADKLSVIDYDEDVDLPLNLETLCFWQWKKQLSTDEESNMHDSELKIVEDVEWNEKKWITLEETAPKSKVFVRYYIDPKTHFIWRCDVKDPETMKAEMDLTVTALETDVEIDADLFKLSKP